MTDVREGGFNAEDLSKSMPVGPEQKQIIMPAPGVASMPKAAAVEAGLGKDETNGRIGEKLDKVDEIFDNLLDKVKNSPEAEIEARRILINQMREDAKKMKTAADMAELQELKMAMLRNWKQLRKQTEKEPALLEGIQAWGRDFAENKSLYYDRINAVKEEMADQSVEIGGIWADIQPTFGKLIGQVGSRDPFREDNIKTILYEGMRREVGSDGGDIMGNFLKSSGLDMFLESMTTIDSGFDGKDIDVRQVQIFLNNLNRAVSEIAAGTFAPPFWKISDKTKPVDLYPEMEEDLGKLTEKIKELQEAVAKASKIFLVTKKIAGTHFLDVFNQEMPADTNGEAEVEA